MAENFRQIQLRAQNLRDQANHELDEKRRVQLRSLANDLERQAQAKMRPH